MIKAIAEKSLISDWHMIFIPPLFFFFQFTSEDSTLQPRNQKRSIAIGCEGPWGKLSASSLRAQLPGDRSPGGGPESLHLCAWPCLVPQLPPNGEVDTRTLPQGVLRLRCDPGKGLPI